VIESAHNTQNNVILKITFRKFESRDRNPVYRLFRETIWDYMLQLGIVDLEDSNDIDEFFRLQKDLYLHLEQTATEDWVAADDNQEVVGWALASGYKIAPFYEVLLAKESSLKLDRYVMTQSAFIW
jgi:hypothetical protein